MSLLKKRLNDLTEERDNVDKEMDSVIEQFTNIELTETLKSRLLKKDNEFKNRLKKLLMKSRKFRLTLIKLRVVHLLLSKLQMY